MQKFKHDPTVQTQLVYYKASAKYLKIRNWSMYICFLPQIYRVSGALWESDSTRGALALQESSNWVRPHSQEGHVRKYLLSNYAFLVLQTWLPLNHFFIIAVYPILCLIIGNLCGAESLQLGQSTLYSLIFPLLRWGLSHIARYERGVNTTLVISTSNVNIIFSWTEVGGAALRWILNWCSTDNIFPLVHTVNTEQIT